MARVFTLSAVSHRATEYLNGDPAGNSTTVDRSRVRGFQLLRCKIRPIHVHGHRNTSFRKPLQETHHSVLQFVIAFFCVERNDSEEMNRMTVKTLQGRIQIREIRDQEQTGLLCVGPQRNRRIVAGNDRCRPTQPCFVQMRLPDSRRPGRFWTIVPRQNTVSGKAP